MDPLPDVKKSIMEALAARFPPEALIGLEPVLDDCLKPLSDLFDRTLGDLIGVPPRRKPNPLDRFVFADERSWIPEEPGSYFFQRGAAGTPVPVLVLEAEEDVPPRGIKKGELLMHGPGYFLRMKELSATSGCRFTRHRHPDKPGTYWFRASPDEKWIKVAVERLQWDFPSSGKKGDLVVKAPLGEKTTRKATGKADAVFVEEQAVMLLLVSRLHVAEFMSDCDFAESVAITQNADVVLSLERAGG
jgi:hypothetical protein